MLPATDLPLPNDRDMLMDVSRLVWRAWRGGLPTGVDRVCLAYLDHYRSRSLAVIQRRGLHFVLSKAASGRLFTILLGRREKVRAGLVSIAATAWVGARRLPPRPGMVYLNIGHTGLDEPSLPAWIAKARIHAIFFIHDLIPLTHPEYCREGEEKKHRQRMTNVLSSAVGVIGNSRATLDELAGFARSADLPLPRTVAAWISGGRVPDAAPQRSERPYFVTVGTIEGRKNHRQLLEVWRRLVDELGDGTPMLAIIGQRGWRAKETFAALDNLGPLAAHVRELGSTSDEQLAGWIRGAEALLMPTFAEGFGIPVTEALQLGTPVIASDLAVFREIAGEIPTYLDPSDPDAWQRAIHRFLGDPAERVRQRKLMQMYRAPTWEDHFAAVDPWLASLTASSADKGV